jgi:hypothetical protein
MFQFKEGSLGSSLSGIRRATKYLTQLTMFAPGEPEYELYNSIQCEPVNFMNYFDVVQKNDGVFKTIETRGDPTGVGICEVVW